MHSVSISNYLLAIISTALEFNKSNHINLTYCFNYCLNCADKTCQLLHISFNPVVVQWNLSYRTKIRTQQKKISRIRTNFWFQLVQSIHFISIRGNIKAKNCEPKRSIIEIMLLNMLDISTCFSIRLWMSVITIQ